MPPAVLTASHLGEYDALTMMLARFHERVAAIQEAIRESGPADGWLFYDFRVSDPLAYRVLLLDSSRHVTRHWYYWVPANGTPVKLLHRIEPYVLAELPGHEHGKVVTAGRLSLPREAVDALVDSAVGAEPGLCRDDGELPHPPRRHLGERAGLGA